MAGQRYSRLNGTGDTQGDGRVLDFSRDLDRPLADDLTKGSGSTLETFRFKNYDALFSGDDRELNPTDLLKIIAKTEYDRFALETLGNAFTPFIFTIGVTPTLILPPNKSPRGYLFLNPSQQLTGATLDTNMFTPAVRGAGTYLSNAINVQGLRTARFFLNITASPATMSVNLQSRDPQTLNWATVQTDIFAGVVAIGTYYATVGEIGVDDFLRLQVVTTGAAENWSITMVNKEAFGSTVSAPGIYLGNANVTAGFGYPILGGQEKRFWLMDNTPLYGIGLVPGNLSVFQLQ
jgi:hypothetical protein